jgi:hypothetical protein
MPTRDKKAPKPASEAQPSEDDTIQGEGDYAADRRFRKRTDRFLESADVDELAREAAPTSKVEAEQMTQAQAEGRSHAHLPGKAGRKADGPAR